jgi:uncharacterized damage-inducible protein DinB
MKELLQQYVAYTIWANEKMYGAISKLTEEQVLQPVNSSFKSIHHTLLHMWDAEGIWWQRMKLQEQITVPSSQFNGTTAELHQKMKQQHELWKEWVDNATEAALQHEFIYHNNKREQFKQPIWQMLLHIANHGTYHRGQLVTLLRQLGVEQIPPTDFIVFARTKK